ncbi:hypothetical protein CLOM_g12456 [Closterium sp. NIES-68]|nr:hypothetical protein CLOM_g12456 [Closterium sp. NIES-68]
MELQGVAEEEGVGEAEAMGGALAEVEAEKSKAEVTFGPTSCRAKLGKKVLWSLEEETSCIKDVAEQMLEMQFKCSKMGEVKYYLGMHVERDVEKGVLRLHQRKYCEGLAEKYGLQDGGKPATPLPSGFTVEPCADEEVVGENKEVRLEIVKTHQQAADIFTKRLAEADHWKGMKLAGMSVH